MTLTSLDRATVEAFPMVERLDPEWARVHRTTYLVRQQVRYDYPAPVADLRQRLLLIPPLHHRDQRRLTWWVDASVPAQRRQHHDRFGNLIVDFSVARVETTVEFSACAVVERWSGVHPPQSRPHPSLYRPSSLTDPGPELSAVAQDLAGRPDLGGGGLGVPGLPGLRGEELAERVCDWTARRLTYQHGVTSVSTTAREACALGIGVCQDFAHVMLALCRQAGLPARYVSGHLLGEGASHAWVEVLHPNLDGTSWRATAFDPTHNRRTGLDYLTVATGRDYRDVAPTSGTCRSSAPGRLHMTKQAAIADIEYHPTLSSAVAS